MPTTFDAVTDHIEQAQAELQALTRQLFSGAIDLDEWENAAAGVLKDARLSAATYARGGVENMTATEWGRMGGNYGDELNHLHQFALDIQSGKVSEAQALARIDQYGNASQSAYWSEFGRLEMRSEWNALPRLNNSPGDGQTRCHGNCSCSVTTEDDGLHWNLGSGESCEGCTSLAAGGPYRPGDM